MPEMQMKWIATGIVLFILAIEDVKERKVSVLWIVVLALIGLVDFLFWNHPHMLGTWTNMPDMEVPLIDVSKDGGHYYKTRLLEIVSGIVPGSILLTTSFVTRAHIGAGDGLALMSLGVVCGLQHTLAIFFYSSLCVGIVATVLLLGKKKKKDTSLPHLLYIFIGYIIALPGIL